MRKNNRSVVDWLDVKTRLRQLTTAPYGHILTNVGVWSHDGEWIVYDTRSDPAGAVFDGDRIERVHVETGRCEVVFRSPANANCGVATCSPTDSRIVCILGPDKRKIVGRDGRVFPVPGQDALDTAKRLNDASPGDLQSLREILLPEQSESDWEYSMHNRCGVVFRPESSGHFEILDARNLLPPYSPGALRGGTHLHTFSGDGQWLAMTYEDSVLANAHNKSEWTRELNQRNIAVSAPDQSVEVPSADPRNYSGSHFTTVVTRTWDRPTPNTDEIDRAYEEAWVGSSGYRRSDGSWQHRAIAFLGDVRRADDRKHTEVFICDLPVDTIVAGAGPLEGTEFTRPNPPRGTTQRRLTFTTDRSQGGAAGPRHWVRSSNDGEKIGFLMRDQQLRAQFFVVSPRGGDVTQITNSSHSIGSAFTWSPDDRFIAYASQDAIWIVEVETAKIREIAKFFSESLHPRPEAVVFSPCGGKIAIVAPVEILGRALNQVHVIEAVVS